MPQTKNQIRIKKAFGKVFIQEKIGDDWKTHNRSPKHNLAGESQITDLYHRLLAEGYQQEVK